MAYLESLVDIIDGIVSGLTFPVTIKSVVETTIVTDEGETIDVYAITTCDIYHAQPSFYVTIGGHSYLIRRIDASTNVLYVSGSVSITATSFNLYTPYFFHGVPIEVGNELMNIPDAVDKTPMIWLHENYLEEIDRNPESIIERVSSFRLFFLTQANNELWLVDTAYENAIMPMRRLSEIFISALEEATGRFETDDFKYDVTNYAKFGVYISNKGVLKNMFVDKLGGCELAMDLPIIKDLSCCDYLC